MPYRTLLTASGPALLAALAAAAALLPEPVPAPAPVRQELARGWLRIVTGGDEAALAVAAKALANQRAYAKRHGYGHEVHEGNYASPWAAYWHKIHVLLRELRAPPSLSSGTAPDVLAWMDLDVVVTNPPQQMLERVLEAHPNASVILTEDPWQGGGLPSVGRAKRLVNTGIILARRGAAAEEVLERLFAFGRQHRSAAYLPQDTNTLHEQDAFNWLLGGPLGRMLRRHVAVVPQRDGELNLNTFPRNLYDESFRDPLSAEWAVGDFTAHCSGLRPQQREWCLDDSVAAADAEVLRAECGDGCHENRTSVESPEASHNLRAEQQLQV